MIIISSLSLITQSRADDGVDEIIQQHLKILFEALHETSVGLHQQTSRKPASLFVAFQKSRFLSSEIALSAIKQHL
jgi:hypothetical protein